ncbi:MAG TPA: excinuclease ABC subunit UvrB [Herpetosiphonaceae bacterium]
MAPFKVHAPYQPMGDQPAAIEKLVAGVENNLRHQTLLGATGTGKSLGFTDPVFVVEQRGGAEIARVTPIGPLIDQLIDRHSAWLRADGDTLILDCGPETVRLATQAFNPETGAVDLFPIQSLTRHSAPERMYKLATACGRSATLTGDHNLWVLRDGSLQLIETADARTTDCVPLPERLRAPAADPAANQQALLELAVGRAVGAQSTSGAQPLRAGAMGAAHLDDPVNLPENWARLADETLAHYVYQYFHIADYGRLAAPIAERETASQLAYALLRFGIHASLEPDQSGGWLVAIRDLGAVSCFNERIGFPVAGKPIALPERPASPAPDSGHQDLRWTPIASVEPVEYDHPHVYDFSVPGAETFLAGEGGFFVHNTYVMAQIVEQVQRPTLVMAHNKTLAAQLYAEFKEFFPENAVGYFVSYYDAYTPEAYVPSKDLYIEKEAQINEEIDRLRHEATQALFTRRDVLIVASVSAIYGLGSPTDYGQVALSLRTGEVRNRDKVLRTLIDLQFERNDIDFHRGTFRVRGDTLEIFPANAETAYRVEMWGDEIERMVEVDPLTGEVLVQKNTVDIFPAKHFVTTGEKTAAAIGDIEAELTEQLALLEGEGKILEAARLRQRTMYDLEIMQELGYCSGIENYSRHLDRRAAGQTPWTLLDYFPDDFLLFVDESHISVPQIRGMFNGDRSRKQTLVDFGFRLPSALDNRPLTFDEFERHVHQAVYVSATPGPYEYEHSEQIAEQIIRPTGLLDPVVEVRPVRGQIDDLLGEIKRRVDSGSRALVTTLTKRMAEDLTDYLKEMGVRTQYLHSDVDTIERIDILRDLRLGVYDVLVGINLLREGLDLPEVSLVAILDADKEGFLRSQSALIQTIGRAARHLEGTVLMYADRITPSMQHAIDETKRRRKIQDDYNVAKGIEPRGIVKEVRDLTDRLKKVAEEKATYQADSAGGMDLSKDELFKLVTDLEKQMKQAAKELEFEKAALLRDQVHELRRTLALIDDQAMVESVSHSRPRGGAAPVAPADSGKKKAKGRPRGKL